MQEFNYIEKYFKKLVKYKGALGLQKNTYKAKQPHLKLINKYIIKSNALNVKRFGNHFFHKNAFTNV